MKKEIEEKTTVTEENFVIRAQQFFQKNAKWIAICGGAIIVIVAFLCLRAFVFTPSNDETSKDGFYAENYYILGIDNNSPDDLKKALDGDGKHLGLKKLVDKYSAGLTQGSSDLAHTYKYMAGNASLRLGKYDEAIKFLEDYNTEEYYTSSLKVILLGDAYLEKGDTKKAQELYLKAAEINPNDLTSANALWKAGMCCLKLNDNAGALKHFNTVKEKYPMSAEYNTIDYYIGIAEAK